VHHLYIIPRIRDMSQFRSSTCSYIAWSNSLGLKCRFPTQWIKSLSHCDTCSDPSHQSQ